MKVIRPLDVARSGALGFACMTASDDVVHGTYADLVEGVPDEQFPLLTAAVRAFYQASSTDVLRKALRALDVDVVGVWGCLFAMVQPGALQVAAAERMFRQGKLARDWEIQYVGSDEVRVHITPIVAIPAAKVDA